MKETELEARPQSFNTFVRHLRCATSNIAPFSVAMDIMLVAGRTAEDFMDNDDELVQLLTWYGGRWNLKGTTPTSLSLIDYSTPEMITLAARL